MTNRIRLLVCLTRPPVLVLLGLFAATGVAQGGGSSNNLNFVAPLIVVVGYLLFSVTVNDLADEAIDRVNLPGVASRPLVTGAGSRHEMTVMAVTAGTIALAASATIGSAAMAVLAGGLVLSAVYSLRPIRLSDRGAVASLLLPAGYVAVPYLMGLLTMRTSLTAADLLLLGGLYVGFIGRILLKDFRDVKGDALFGKRTFLVRHGRRRTCLFSAIAWVIGSFALSGVRDLSMPLVVAYAVLIATALVLLRALANDQGRRRDDRLISAIAIVGRGMLLAVIAHLSMTEVRWSTLAIIAVQVLLTVLTLGQANLMAKHGPRPQSGVPGVWTLDPERSATP